MHFELKLHMVETILVFLYIQLKPLSLATVLLVS